MNLAGANVAIIGGGGGIGLALVEGLARRGARLNIGDIAPDAAEAAARTALNLGAAEALAIRVDLARPGTLDALVDCATADGPVDLLINHAGVSVAGRWEAIPDDEWNRVLNTNVAGFAASIRRFIPHMKAGGRIVNTASGLGLFHDLPIAGPYVTSKAAIVGLSRALAEYLKPSGVGVTLFCPDLTDTPFVTSAKLYGLGPNPSGPPAGFKAQSPAAAAQALIDALERDQFLVNLAPEGAARLVAQAAGGLEPGAEKRPVGVLIQAEIALPEGSGDRARALRDLERFAAAVRQEPGCLRYRLLSAVGEPELLVLDELWESPEALDRHKAAASTQAFLQEAAGLGLRGFSSMEQLWPMGSTAV